MAYFYGKSSVSDLLELDTFFASGEVFSRNYYLGDIALPALTYFTPRRSLMRT